MKKSFEWNRTKLLKSKRGLGPLVPTFVLVIVTLTLSFVGSQLIGQVFGESTSIERLEMTGVICSQIDGNWRIRVYMKNAGTTNSVLIGCSINDVELDQYGRDGVVPNKWVTNMTESTSIEKNQRIIIDVYIDPDRGDSTLSSGTRVNLRIHCSSGMDYYKLIRLV